MLHYPSRLGYLSPLGTISYHYLNGLDLFTYDRYRNTMQVFGPYMILSQNRLTRGAHTILL